MPEWCWDGLHAPRPLDETTAIAGLARLALDPAQAPCGLELRAESGRVACLLAARSQGELSRLSGLLGTVRLGCRPVRRPVERARRLGWSTSVRGLGAGPLSLSAQALLAALAAAGAEEQLVLQLFVGRRRGAWPVEERPFVLESGGLWRALWSGPQPLDGEARRALADKQHLPGMRAVVRLGVTAGSAARRHELLLGLFAALRTLEGPGLHLALKPCPARRVDTPRAPRWGGWDLSAREAAALTAWPVGEAVLPGLPPLHPRPLSPQYRLAAPGRGRLVIGPATAPGASGLVSLSVPAVLRGVHLLGPPGVGKSHLAARLAVQWINQGRAAVILEPKTDLGREVLARLDPAQAERVVVLDPADAAPVGLNPLRRGGRPPELVADGLLEVFAGIFADSLGVRTRDVVHAALLTLAHLPQATLVQLPRLLADGAYRTALMGRVRLDAVLRGFWAWYEAQSEPARQQLIAPVLSRLRQVLLRPALRACLGQPEPRVGLDEVFGPGRRVLIASLPEARLGREGAALFGALVLHEVFAAVKRRATAPPSARHPVLVVADEFQNYLRAARGLGEAIAMFRGLGCGLLLANQAMAQLPPELRSVVGGVVRSRMYFQLGPEDAHELARRIPELEARDLLALPPFHVYAGLYEAGANRPFVSAAVEALPPPGNDPERLIAASRSRYGIDRQELEQRLAVELGAADPDPVEPGSVETADPAELGRRPRSEPGPCDHPDNE